jgi:hypothetical protein
MRLADVQLRLAVQERMADALDGLNDVHGSRLSVTGRWYRRRISDLSTPEQRLDRDADAPVDLMEIESCELTTCDVTRVSSAGQEIRFSWHRDFSIYG